MGPLFSRRHNMGRQMKLKRHKKRKLLKKTRPSSVHIGDKCKMLLFSLEDVLKKDYSRYSIVKEMSGKNLDSSFFKENKFLQPLLFKNKSGLGLTVPPSTFSVHDICKHVGSRTKLNVTDNKTGKSFSMPMKEWTEYYSSNPKRDKLLSVMSLEFSQTNLANYITRPYIVQQLDWVSYAWPNYLKESYIKSTNVVLTKMNYPVVQNYCFMSVKGCYSNFHINFGGTSAWYHILKGKQTFWLIPPINQTFEPYQKWVKSGRQRDMFFGDMVEYCTRVDLVAGNTFFLPSGWIYAVYTSEDSIVFGGNFLHSYNMINQIRVANIENSIKVPQELKYPYFVDILWYVLEWYVHRDLGKSHLKGSAKSRPFPEEEHVWFTKQELYGLVAILRYLTDMPHNKRNVPKFIFNVEDLLMDLGLVLETHINDEAEKTVPDLIRKNNEKKKEKIKVPKKSKITRISKKQNINAKSVSKRKRLRCNNCEACKRSNCQQCGNCKDMIKYGGPGRRKQTCINRRCLQRVLPKVSTSQICSLDSSAQQATTTAKKTKTNKVMEYSKCLEVAHPDCLLSQPCSSRDLPELTANCPPVSGNDENHPNHLVRSDVLINWQSVKEEILDEFF